nr:hypothetical protein [Cupriavidus taiwanensis]
MPRPLGPAVFDGTDDADGPMAFAAVPAGQPQYLRNVTGTC